MLFIKKIVIGIFKTAAVVLLLIAGYIVAGFLVAPIYRFAAPQPFEGEHIYNPYEEVGEDAHWYRANFHAHSYLRFGLTYGAKTPAEVVEDYRSYDYEIIGISNYQTITRYEPDDRDEFNMPVYEHGYNPLLFHQLVFGELSRTGFDIPLPLSTFQKQYVLGRVGRRADIVCVNHPNFSRMFAPDEMRKLQGYRLIEAETGMASSARFWDEGLSAGRASFCLSGDDSHDTSRPHDIATDCSFIASRSTKYADILEALRTGRHYAMKIPNFGSGDTTVKHAMNRLLPQIERIGMSGDTIRVIFSEAADSVRFIGQGGREVFASAQSSTAEYRFAPEDTYIRVEASFSSGVHIFSNPFFRYREGDPFAIEQLQVKVWATIGKDVAMGAVLIAIVWAIYLLIKPKRKHGKDKRPS
ncbi:phosphoesterase [Bacteroidia bacterium]|nr:phosphoesterase [Bacteroidia bacterium]